ncbi:hypothetical protein B0H14DRAFT_2348646, partial [Mycena olivaceomarginata]
ETWSGWPNGRLQCLFSPHQVASTNQLAINWVCEVLSGHRGSAEASTWEKGKEIHRSCIGVLECSSRFCSEKNEFSKVVEQNPSAGPLKLLVGRPGVHGPGESVADISPVLFNAERIKYERRRILKGARRPGGDSFSEAFARFEEKHPGFILEAQFGDVSVIVMQTPFMSSKLVESVIDDDAVNGIVSDAAHGFWQERNGILIISSTFEPDRLKCWVPGIMSYSNGGTAEHYRIHFVHLFMGMARECLSREIAVTDGLFANVSTHFFFRLALTHGSGRGLQRCSTQWLHSCLR